MGRIDSAFVTRKATATLVILDRAASTVRTEHQFELVARRVDRFYVREYTWVSQEGLERPLVIHSGEEENGIKSHRQHGPVLQGAGAERIAVIDLGRILEVGDSETIEFEHFFISTKPENPWFVGNVAAQGCKHMTLRAVLPLGTGTRVRFRSFRSGADESYRDKPLEPHPVRKLLTPLERPSAWQEYSYEVSNPKPGEKYRIQWDM